MVERRLLKICYYRILSKIQALKKIMLVMYSCYILCYIIFIVHAQFFFKKLFIYVIYSLNKMPGRKVVEKRK